jgi:putative transposase
MVVRKRLDIKGRAVVFITTTVVDWKPVFNNKRVALVVLKQFGESLKYFDIALLGYVLMPSHLHALLGFKDISLMSKFIQSFKILSAKKIKQLPEINKYEMIRWDGTFSLWKPRFDDLVITSEKQFKIKLEYIHNNPVKAGLVAEADSWIYSSASDWLFDKPGLLQVDINFGWL